MSSATTETLHSQAPLQPHSEPPMDGVRVLTRDFQPRPEPAGPDGKPKLKKYAYSFWAPEMKMFRGIIFKILGGTVAISILVMWAALPLYWGSLWKSNKYTDRLTVRIVDRDGGAIGNFVTSALMQETNLNYFITAPSEFPTDALLAENIVEEGAWAAVVISQGASAVLVESRENGLANYAPSSAVQVFYSQARQETAYGSYLVPYVTEALSSSLGQYSAQSAAAYLQANMNNATAIGLLAAAPTTISSSVGYTMVNLRPYDQPVAAAITLVGLIYMLIFAFTITMANNGCREIIAPYLTTPSYLKYRIFVPLALYAVVSFFFAMINLPFKVHFAAHFTYAGGFFLWWVSLYLGMASVGLATEFAITILGPKFIAFFLVPLIIVNVSVASLPHDLQPWIYRYGVAMPFYNCGRIVRCIIFDTKNEIGQNIGILLAWIVVSIITIPVATWLFRRDAVNEHRKAVGENEYDEKISA
ncbi:hypothetical protein P7C73_g3478, partial [Tremellales sp. Uapishka_1]